MYKALVITFLASSAVAMAPMNSMPLVNWNFKDSNGFSCYNGMVSLSYDAGYQTQYNPHFGGGFMQQSQMMSAHGPDNHDTYAFNIFAFLSLNF